MLPPVTWIWRISFFTKPSFKLGLVLGFGKYRLLVKLAAKPLSIGLSRKSRTVVVIPANAGIQFQPDAKRLPCATRWHALDSRVHGNDEWENEGDGKRASQRPAERLMQQRLLQIVQRGEFLLVEGFEALGFLVKLIQLRSNFSLLLDGR